jgi:hypothetical protein
MVRTGHRTVAGGPRMVGVCKGGLADRERSARTVAGGPRMVEGVAKGAWLLEREAHRTLAAPGQTCSS